MRYQVYPYSNGNIPDEILAQIWRQMVEEDKAKKVFYNGYITSVYDFINFLKTGGVIPILIMDTTNRAICHIAWISDYGDGHACLHHCNLGQFKRGSAKAILKYYGDFTKPETGEFTFDTLVGITPENNEGAVRAAKLMGFKLLSPAVPNLCNDVYSDKRVGGIISYYQYNRGAPQEAPQVDKGVKPWAAAEKAQKEQVSQI